MLVHHFQLVGDETMPEAAVAMLRANAAMPGLEGAQARALLEAFYDRNILGRDGAVPAFSTGDPDAIGADWRSTDVWIRNAPDAGELHQVPLTGQTNWLCARIHNIGDGPLSACVVEFGAALWNAFDLGRTNTVAVGIAVGIPAGESQIVRVPWPADAVLNRPDCMLTATVFAPTKTARAVRNVVSRAALAGATAQMQLQLSAPESDAALHGVVRLLRGPGATANVVLSHPDRELLPNLMQPLPAVVSGPEGTATVTILDQARIQLELEPGGAVMSLDAQPGTTFSPVSAPSGTPQPFAPVIIPSSDLQAIQFGAEPDSGFSFQLPPRASPIFEISLRLPDDALAGTQAYHFVCEDQFGRVIGGVSLRLTVSV